MHRTIEKKLFLGFCATALLFVVVLAAVVLTAGTTRTWVGIAGGVVVLTMMSLVAWQAVVKTRELTRLADALRVAEETNARIIENSADSMATLNEKGELKVVNSAMWKLIESAGLQPVLDLPWSEIWTGEDRRNAIRATEAAQSGNMAYFDGTL